MTASFGLLLDVDGPIADPETRRVGIPSIVTDLVALANDGHPVVFNTGRADVFVREQVLAPMRDQGLREDAPVHAVCEKGATWFSLSDGPETLFIEDGMRVPDEYGAVIRRLVEDEYSELMFWDDTERTMVSIEKVVGADQERFETARDELEERMRDELRRQELDGVYRTDPTIIAVDVQHRDVGKALGARRAMALVAAHGEPPRRWRTAGDSRNDYDMADWLHDHGYEVEHLDVRPAEGVPDKPYRILHDPDLVHDEATAHYLARWRSPADSPQPPQPPRVE